MLRVLVLLLVSISALANQCKIVDQAIQSASQIRGLQLKQTVRCNLVNQEQVRAYLEKAIDEQLGIAKLKNEEAVFKMIGMIPETMNYKEEMIHIYTAELGGYYDPKEKAYFMAAWLPEITQEPVAVHELTHALQDQYYDLGKYVDPKKLTSDQASARSALIEGDATSVMLDYLKNGLKAGADLGLAGDFLSAETMAAMTSQTGVKTTATSLSEFIVFPYSAGLLFVSKIKNENNYLAVDRAFRNAPQTTEEIFHPEKFLAGQKDYLEISEAELSKSSGLKVEYSDVYGELGIRALLRNFVSEEKAVEAASGWGGDRIALLEDRSLFWIINWDTEQDLKQFQDAYLETIRNSSNCVKQANTLSCKYKKISYELIGNKIMIKISRL